MNHNARSITFLDVQHDSSVRTLAHGMDSVDPDPDMSPDPRIFVRSG